MGRPRRVTTCPREPPLVLVGIVWRAQAVPIESVAAGTLVGRGVDGGAAHNRYRCGGDRTVHGTAATACCSCPRANDGIGWDAQLEEEE